MKNQILFSWKNTINVSKCQMSSAEILPSMLGIYKVNEYTSKRKDLT